MAIDITTVQDISIDATTILSLKVGGSQFWPPASSGITYVGGDSDEKDQNDSGLLTMTLPVLANNDFGLMWVNSDGAGNTGIYSEAVVAGWTLQDTVEATSGRDRKAFLFYKWFVPGDSEGTVTIDADPAVYRGRGCSMMVFRGVNTGQAFDVTPVLGQGQNDDTPSTESITPTSDNCCIVSFMGMNAGVSRTVTWTPPLGHELGPTYNSNRTWGAGGYLLDQGTAAPTGNLDWTPTGAAATDEHCDAIIALRRA